MSENEPSPEAMKLGAHLCDDLIGACCWPDAHCKTATDIALAIDAFAAQRVAEEREACAKICDAANEANAKRAKYAAEIETRAEYRAARAEAGSLSAAIRARGGR